jgi:hypothetical protein
MRAEVFTGFWFGGPKGRHHWENLGIGGRRLGSMGQTGFGRFRIESSGEFS